MRLFTIATVVVLAACGGQGQPDRTRTVVELDGVPVFVSWNSEARTRALARVEAGAIGADIDLRDAITQATGCRISDREPMRILQFQNGDRGLDLATDCEGAAAPGEIDREASRRLAQAIGQAVESVSPDGPKVPPLYEGGRYADFTPDMLSLFCAQKWETRVATDGRTEYNPCYRRDAYR